MRQVILALLVLSPLLVCACGGDRGGEPRTIVLRALTVESIEFEVEVGEVRPVAISGAVLDLLGDELTLTVEDLLDLNSVDSLSETERNRLKEVLDEVRWSSDDVAVASVRATDTVGREDDSLSTPAAISAEVTGVALGATSVTATLAGEISDPVSASNDEAPEDLVATVSVAVVERSAESIVASVEDPRVAVETSTSITVVAVVSERDPVNVTDRAAFEVIEGEDFASVDDSGVVDAKGQGTATVRVTFQGQEDTIEIIVRDVVEALEIDPSDDVEVANGSTVGFMARAMFRAAGEQDVTDDVTWESSRESVLSVNAQGLAEGQSTGEATLRATLGEVSAEVLVRVSGAVPQSIEILPAPASVAVGAQLQVRATVIDTDGRADPDAEVVWSVGNGALAAVSQTGQVLGIEAGTTRLIAELDGILAEAVLSVTPAAINALTISLPGGATDVLPGARLQAGVTASLPTVDGDVVLTVESSDVEWSSSDAEVVSIDSGGVVQALKPGEASLNAVFQGVQTSLMLVVVDVEPTGIDITPSRLTMAVASTSELVAEWRLTNGATVPITSEVRWTSSAASVAQVEGAADDTANATVMSFASGSTVITASTIHPTAGELSAGVGILVNGETLTRLEAGPSVISVPVGVEQGLSVAALYPSFPRTIETRNATYRSLEPETASVSDAGVVMGRTIGSTIVSIELSGFIVELPVRVVDAQVSNVILSPANASGSVGQVQQLAVTSIFDNGDVRPVNSGVEFASSDETIATIDDDGRLTGMREGEVEVMASFAGQLARASYTVTGDVLRSLEVAPVAEVVASGGQVQLSAIGIFDRGGEIVNLNQTEHVQWSVEPGAFASITELGLLKANARALELEREVTVFARTAGARAEAVAAFTTLTIGGVRPVSLSVEPSLPRSIAVRERLDLKAFADFSDGVRREVTNQVNFVASLPGVVAIFGGAVTGVTDGQSTTLTAVFPSFDELSSNALTVTVGNVVVE